MTGDNIECEEIGVTLIQVSRVEKVMFHTFAVESSVSHIQGLITPNGDLLTVNGYEVYSLCDPVFLFYAFRPCACMNVGSLLKLDTCRGSGLWCSGGVPSPNQSFQVIS